MRTVERLGARGTPEGVQAFSEPPLELIGAHQMLALAARRPRIARAAPG